VRRKQYIDQIARYHETDTVLICTDETPIDYGGSGRRHVFAPLGHVVYKDQRDPRFSKM